MQRLAYSPLVTFGLLANHFLPILVMSIAVAGTGDDAQVLLKTYDDALQLPGRVLCKGVPWFLDAPYIVAVFIGFHFLANGMLYVLPFFLWDGGIGMTEIVDDVAAGTGYDDGIHGMVAVVQALLAKPGRELQGYVDLEIALALMVHLLPVVLSVGLLVKPHEAWGDEVIPYIVESPVLLQPVGDGTFGGDDALSRSLLLALLAYQARKDAQYLLAHIAAVVELALGKTIGNFAE